MSYANNNANKNGPIKEYSWPKLHWRITKYLSIVSFLLAIIIFSFPELGKGEFDAYRIPIAVLILLLPIISVTVIPWFVRSTVIIIKRAIYYSKVRKEYLEKEIDLFELQQSMVGYLVNQLGLHELEIELVTYKEGALYLTLGKKEEIEVETGGTVEVIDKRDMMLMGKFTISEIRSSVYYAEDVGHVDNLWLTFVKQQGETRFTHNMSAFYIPKGGNDA